MISSLENVDRRFNVDPQIQNKIKYASVIVCSNRPANTYNYSGDEIRYAAGIGKSIVAISTTYSNSSLINELNIPVVANRKDSLETWIRQNL